MGSYLTLDRGQRRQLAALALLALAIGLVALAAQQPLAAALLTLALAVAGGALVAARPARSRRARPAFADFEAAPTLRLELASGELLNARPVALPGEGAEQLLLTRDGYMVVDGDGRVLHRL